MIKIGITGSISSGKTTASKIISNKKGPLFSADMAIKKLYKQNFLKKVIAKKLAFKFTSKFKINLINEILNKKESFNKLEKIIHPLVRKEMFVFLKKNKNKKFLFLEIPLLVENKLSKHFDKIIFIKSNKKLRQKRYQLMGGNKKLFKFLNGKQMKDSKKIKFCDHIIVNNKSLSILKKKLIAIMENYD